MKKLLTLLAFGFVALSASAAQFTFKNSDLADLIAAIRSLDGYDRAIDQGPGNGSRVIHQAYTFSRETRAKLGADLTVVLAAAKKVNEDLDALRLEIGGNAQAIDEKDPEQLKLWGKRYTELMNKPVTLELSPITNDELKPGSGDGENPIPISVLAILNWLRPTTK